MTDDRVIDQLFDAAIFAAQKHQGQVRKDLRGSPYVTHPLAVARVLWQIGGVRKASTLVAAILHDTLEDTSTTPTEIQERFGPEVLTAILEVTDDKSLGKMERKRLQVAHARELSQPARLVKLGDKLINCQDILDSPPKDWSLQRRQDYIQWAADVVAQIRGTNPALEAALDQVFAQAEAQLNFTLQPFSSVNERPWAPNPHSPQPQE